MREEVLKDFEPIFIISGEWMYKKYASHGKNKHVKCAYLPQVSEKEGKNRSLIPRI